MTTANQTLSNFAAGELSPLMHGRYDLALYRTGLEFCQNFVPELQGPLSYRTGTRYVHNTRGNAVAALIPFQFSDQQAYILEFTEKKIRVFKDEAIVVESAKVITGISQANPGVVTSVAHGYSTGDEVFISSVVGMTELNSRFFLVGTTTANTFQLKDIDGNNVNTTSLTAYSSGGTAARVVEIMSPYLVTELLQVQYTQNADTMYLFHRSHLPLKLTRTGHSSWTLKTFVRTDDPFLTFAATKNISAITLAAPGVITTTAVHSLTTGDLVQIQSIIGTTQLNDQQYYVDVITTTTFSLRNLDGTAFSTVGMTAWSSGGTVARVTAVDFPGSGSFYESRLVYGGTDTNPELIFASMAADPATGDTRYDTFTLGTDPTDAMLLPLANTQGKIDAIQFMRGTTNFLLVGTYSGLTRVDGGSDDTALSPTTIRARTLDGNGCKRAMPISGSSNETLYIQLNSRILRSLEFNFEINAYDSIDRNLASEHITKTGLTQVVFQRGRPDIAWATRTDGLLVGVTYKSSEDVSGWHRHVLGGVGVKVLSVAIIPREDEYEQLYVVCERTIGSTTRRYVEFFTDKIEPPQRIEFFKKGADEKEDNDLFTKVLLEEQKSAVHLDSSLSLDGSDRGTDASATLTPASITGSSITFTASAAVFTPADVGRFLIRKTITGEEFGKAEIVGYTSTTVVTCDVIEDFNATTAIPAGEWYITFTSVSGLRHLAGETVQVSADGGTHSDVSVNSSGVATLEQPATIAHIGYSYRGVGKIPNLEIGGQTGPAQVKNRNVSNLGLRFLNTLGCQVGPNLYELTDIIFREVSDPTDSPPPLWTGVILSSALDSWRNQKVLFVVQEVPLPCTVAQIDVTLDIVEEGG